VLLFARLGDGEKPQPPVPPESDQRWENNIRRHISSVLLGSGGLPLALFYGARLDGCSPLEAGRAVAGRP
jgi:hypothetical protein